PPGKARVIVYVDVAAGAGLEDSLQAPEHTVHVLDVLEYLVGYHEVEGVIGEGQLPSAGRLHVHGVEAQRKRAYRRQAAVIGSCEHQLPDQRAQGALQTVLAQYAEILADAAAGLDDFRVDTGRPRAHA